MPPNYWLPGDVFDDADDDWFVLNGGGSLDEESEEVTP